MTEGIGLLALKCFYIMLPAYFANMAPVIVKRINIFDYPVDFNAKINKKPLLGKNKTFRGIIFGIIFAIAVAYAQFSFHKNGFFSSISFISYENWFLFGFLMGAGALTGDLIKSFFKRRLNLKPGQRFVPFDQMDFVIGAFLLVMPVFRATFEIFMMSLALSFVLDIIVNHLAFYFGIRKEKW